ncbi:UPF0687 protein C20orf27 homolog [Copidosoma floridanum]|uniref:UPF0687 protein C20orf27 homolog n=1 Tax=Copidosoma floridanum TaxID=29053 RepID=UPI0006C9E19D|nr:UPF0687 protein C20orf27 homolog [Copidosoma floridanum]
MGDKEHYVHFSSASGVGCNNIVIQPLRHGHLNVNLGFLQIHHIYHIEFTVPWNKCVVHPDDESSEPAIPTGKKNANCRIVDCSKEKDDLRLKVELFVHTERFLKEEFQITCCVKGAPLTIYLNARVFGEDQGTPILRNGIRNVGKKDHHAKKGQSSGGSDKDSDADSSD